LSGHLTTTVMWIGLRPCSINFIIISSGNLPLNIRDDYALSLAYMGLSPLSFRREFLGLCFVFKILNNLIDLIEIYNVLEICDPLYAVRSVPLFNINYCRTNYSMHSPSLSNKHSQNLDFFACSFVAFKNHVRRI